MKKTLFYIISISIFFIFFSCAKQEPIQEDIEFLELIPEDVPESDSIKQLNNTEQRCKLTNKRIYVILGYDFNSLEISGELVNLLQKNYGLASEGGLIYPLVYPNDFRHAPRGYVNDLLTELQSDDKDICGVIILGAPENTHTAFARNQDKWNRDVPYPVIALFPQDDVLGLESTCDIVIDKGQTVNISGEVGQEEIEGQLIAEAPEVLLKTIDYIQNLSYSLTKDTKIHTHLLQMLKMSNIRHYTDPETGLQSINHFVLN